MNVTESYLNSNPDIKNVVFFSGDSFEGEKILYLISQASLDEMIVVGYIAEITGKSYINLLKEEAAKRKIKIPDFFEYCHIDKFSTEKSKNWALVFYHLNNQNEILPFMQFSPNSVLGSLWENEYNGFFIWECFRKFSEHIRIETLRPDAPPQILSWDKRDSSIEVSAIFPMYKVADYLEKCLETVTKRKDDWIEFLFVNDGSPDNCREIVLKWAEKDNRIKLLDKENGGCASARQFGLERVKGQYVSFIDPDDFVDEQFFYKLFRAALTGSYEISYCAYYEYYENSKETKLVPDVFDWWYQKGTQDPHLIRNLIGYTPIGIWRRLYSIEMLKKFNIHFYTDLRRFDDLPFKVECFANARSVIGITEPLYYYRLSRPGQDISCDDERLYVHFDIFNYLDVSVAGKKDAELTDWLQCVKVHTHQYALQKIQKKYRKIYLKKAIVDLNKNEGFFHTFALMKKRFGKKHALSYLGMRLHLFSLI